MNQAPWIKVSVKDNAYQLQPLTQVHLYQPDGTPTGMQTVKIFLIVAIFIILISCINYVNLSTARSVLRAKEVSVRKIVGAQKKQLFMQFAVGSVLFFTISLVCAFILMVILLPGYNDLSGKHLHLNLLDWNIWKVVLVTLVVTLMASAVYPSWLLSSFDPLKSLRGKSLSGIGNITLRKVLVTAQFVFSITLIITTFIISRQLKYIHEKDPGYQRSQVFFFRINNMQMHLKAIKAELKSLPGIEAVTTSDNKLVDNTHTTAGVDWDGKEPNTLFVVHHLGIDENFIPTLKIKLLAGSNFTAAKSDSVHFMLNETAVRLTGIKNPIGKRFKYQETEGIITAVIKDFNTASLRDRIEPTVIYYEPKGDYLYIKTTGAQAAKAIASATRLWTQYNPGFPFEYTFMDEEYGDLYKTEHRTGILFSIFSFMTIMVSCLGLLGLAAYSAQAMTKEIGIRKILGASIVNIVTLITKGFLEPVLLAILIASPIAWWVASKWLQNFAYRVHISWWITLVAGVMAILIAVSAISFQSIKAALVNPIKSLRSE